MKYKILTNGKWFIIKYKNFLFWHIVAKIEGFDFLFPVYFHSSSEKEAEKYARLRWGSEAERVREWRIV